MTHSYGRIADIGDIRDLKYSFPVYAPLQLPTSVDLSQGLDSPFDQGKLGSCVSQAVSEAMIYTRRKQGLPDFIPSRLEIYFYARSIEHTIHSDSGCSIRDGIKSASKYGACSEIEWPYDISKFMLRPPTKVARDGKNDRALTYQSIPQNLDLMKECLASGLPFVFGISVYDSFESQEVSSSGVVLMPSTLEQLLGGHALLCYGYNDNDQTFLFQNSWGESWGLQGRGTIPYTYLLNPQLASDFWVVQSVG